MHRYLTQNVVLLCCVGKPVERGQLVRIESENPAKEAAGAGAGAGGKAEALVTSSKIDQLLQLLLDIDEVTHEMKQQALARLCF